MIIRCEGYTVKRWSHQERATQSGRVDRRGVADQADPFSAEQVNYTYVLFDR